MKIEKEEIISMLEKVGFDYDKRKNCFFSRDYEVEFYLPDECNDLSDVINRLISFERRMASYWVIEGLKSDIKRWLDL